MGALAIAAIMRDEAPYVIEWIAHHQVIGFDRFIIADDSSRDGTTEILSALHAAGGITHIPAQRAPGRNVQVMAYQSILDAHCADVDWIACIDADEMIMPQQRSDLRAWLDEQPADVSALLLNWAIYGSGGQKEPDSYVAPSPVTDRFVQRARQSFVVNAHVKTISRPDAVRYEILPRGCDGHVPHLLRGRPCLSDGSAAQLTEIQGRALSRQPVTWGAFRVNHYYVKSLREYLQKKSRGVPSDPERYSLNSFSVHDVGELYDPYPPGLRAARDAQMADLQRLVVQYRPGYDPARYARWKTLDGGAFLPERDVDVNTLLATDFEVVALWQLQSSGEVVCDLVTHPDLADGITSRMDMRLQSDRGLDCSTTQIVTFGIDPAQRAKSRWGVRLVFAPAQIDETADLSLWAAQLRLRYPLTGMRPQPVAEVPPLPPVSPA